MWNGFLNVTVSRRERVVMRACLPAIAAPTDTDDHDHAL